MTDLVGCIDCGHQTGHLPECPRSRSPITQVRLGDLKSRAERYSRAHGLSVSALLRLALAEYLHRMGG